MNELRVSKDLLTKFLAVSFIMAKPEKIQMSNRRRDNYTTVYSYSGILLNNRKKCLLLTQNNMNEPHRNYAN